MSATLYRILGFFQKYDILGKFHSDVLFGDEFEGFASDCSDFAEIKSVIGLQENLSGYTSAAIFGDITESVSLDSSIKPIVYSDKYGEFKSPALIDNTIEGLSAGARLGRYDNGINLSSSLSGLKASVKISGSQSSIFLPSFSEGITSAATYGSVGEDFVGEISVKDFKSTPVFGTSEETVELLSSIKATVVTPTPTTKTIPAGLYASRTDITSVQAVYIDIPIYYVDEVGTPITASNIEAKHVQVVGTWIWLMYADSTIFGYYYNNQWALFLNEGETGFTVLQDTTVSQEQYDIFMRYFTPIT